MRFPATPSRFPAAALLSLVLAVSLPAGAIAAPARRATQRPAAKPRATARSNARHKPARCRKVTVRVNGRLKRRTICAKARRKPTPNKKPTLPTSLVSVTQTSADLSQALTPQPGRRLVPNGRHAGLPVIGVNDSVHYQRFTGAGAAMTDSSAWLIYERLPAVQRDALLRSLFSAAGAHLSFVRVPIGASDYSATGVPYSYDDMPAGETDPGLAHFSVAHDEAYILPALRAAQALNPSLSTEAVPWSPPGWMKANDALDNINAAGTLLPQFYPALARYFVKFLQAYAAQKVHVSAIALQNEPEVPASYPGLELQDPQEAAFVADNLRPALAAAGLTPSVFGWDQSFGPISASDPLVAQSASGILSGLAWHCYFGSPDYMSGAHAAAPNSQQIVDECSTGSYDTWTTSELLISSLRNWANAVSLWNLALDPQGRPVQPPDSGCGGCTGVVTVNPQTGTWSLSKDYYQLAQLSHFVSPGAVRIATPTFVAYRLGLVNNYQTVISPGLDDVAFRNPDGSKVLLAYNNSPAPITFAVGWHGSYTTDTIPAGATTTLTWR